MIKIATLFASACLLSQIGHAELKTEYVMNLEFANSLASNVMKACQSQTKAAAVVVLDQGGNVITSQRHETVGIHNLIAAQRKAFTAYSSKTSTLDFMRNAQKTLMRKISIHFQSYCYWVEVYLLFIKIKF